MLSTVSAVRAMIAWAFQLTAIAMKFVTNFKTVAMIYVTSVPVSF